MKKLLVDTHFMNKCNPVEAIPNTEKFSYQFKGMPKPDSDNILGFWNTDTPWYWVSEEIDGHYKFTD